MRHKKHTQGLGGLPPVCNIPGFMDWFDPELNPDFDPEEVTAGSNRLFYYRDSNGVICHTQLGCFVRSISTPNGKHVKLALAKDNERFMKRFDPALNPGLDLETLTQGSAKPFRYVDDFGNVRVKSVKDYMRLKNDNLPVYSAEEKRKWQKKAEKEGRKSSNDGETRTFLSEIPFFMEHFEAELNPDFDPKKVSTGQNDVVFHYRDNSGRIRSKTTSNFLKSKTALDPIELCTDYPEFLDIMNDPRNKELNKDLPIDDLRVRSNLRIEYFDVDDNFHSTNIDALMKKIKKEHRIKELIKSHQAGMVSVLDIDPEIKDFWISNESLSEIYAYSNKVYSFECPLCYRPFSMRMSSIVGKHPKCPYCEDRGEINLNSDFPDSVPFVAKDDYDLRKNKGNKGMSA